MKNVKSSENLMARTANKEIQKVEANLAAGKRT
jgi:hypothetical protein